MKKNRLIPVLLLKNGWLVQSKGFREYKNLGDPITAVKRLSEWASDELIYLDISKDDVYDRNREEHGHPNRKDFYEIIKDVAATTFMPLSVGGKINTLKDIEKRLKLGADKITINSIVLENPNFITDAAKEFGSQCIIISIDVKSNSGNYKVYSHKKNLTTDIDPLKLSKECEDLGAGEIFINSVERDGMGSGYDLKLIDKIAKKVSIPVIACGGVGDWNHFSEALKTTNVDAVAAANIFHYKDQSVYLAKKFLHDDGLNVRKPVLMNLNNNSR